MREGTLLLLRIPGAPQGQGQGACVQRQGASPRQPTGQWLREMQVKGPSAQAPSGHEQSRQLKRSGPEYSGCPCPAQGRARPQGGEAE